MKKIHLLATLALLSLLTACVQPVHKRVVVLTLSVPGGKPVQIAGIRGEGKPLSWDKDYPMQTVIPDSLYRAVITTYTGFLSAEYKCTVNGVWELPDAPNRVLVFSRNADTSFVHIQFNQR